MSKLQEQTEMAWETIYNIKMSGWCKHPRCCICPMDKIPRTNCNVPALQNWLHVNGFPTRRPRIHTVAELAKQIIKGSSLSCLTQRTVQHAEAVTCPDCGKHTLHRERRMVCNGCNGIYPADKWAAGEPCDCGCMDARYFGNSANRLGQLEFQQCQTPGCRWGGDYRRLTVQELANTVRAEADEQWAAARTCPACGDASGDDQIDGAYLSIKSCACGWIKTEPEEKEK